MAICVQPGQSQTFDLIVYTPVCRVGGSGDARVWRFVNSTSYGTSYSTSYISIYGGPCLSSSEGMHYSPLLGSFADGEETSIRLAGGLVGTVRTCDRRFVDRGQSLECGIQRV